MKKHLFILALAVAPLFVGCSDSDDDGTASVTLTVSNIADNQATIHVSVSGKNTGARLVEAVALSSLDIDYTDDITLVSYVNTRGVSISVPYTHTVTGLQADANMFTAVIVYNTKGGIADYTYQIWRAEGDIYSWSEDGNAGGDLEGATWPQDGEGFHDADGDAGDLGEELW